MPVMEGKAMLFKEFAAGRRLPDLPGHQRRRRDHPARSSSSPPPSAASTSRTSPPRAASRSRTGSRRSSTSPSSTTTSTAPPWWCMAALLNALKLTGKPIEEPSGPGARPRRRRRRGDEDPAGGRGAPRSSAATRQGASAHGPLRLRRRLDVRRSSAGTPRTPTRSARDGAPADVIDGCDLVHRPLGRRAGPAGVAGEDERRRDRLRDGQPHPGGAAGGRRPVRADHGHGPLRLPQPDQQRPLLPRHLPRRAGRAGAPDHRGDEDGGRPGDRRQSSPRTSCAEDYIIPSVFNRDVAPSVARAVAEEAKAAGLARFSEETGTFEVVGGDGAAPDTATADAQGAPDIAGT